MRPKVFGSLAAVGVLTTLVAVPVHANAAPAEMFDDFSYTGWNDGRLSDHGWSLRTGDGGPGGSESSWAKGNVSFPETEDGGRALQMAATTNGKEADTKQSGASSERKYQHGTYAARVKFSDAPSKGPDGDKPVQTFFAIGAPLKEPNDPDFSEVDFEYLPNGGWNDRTDPTMYIFSYETYNPEPWEPDYAPTELQESFDGWHDLVIQSSAAGVKYFIDGKQVADHDAKYAPEQPMSIKFNHWFNAGGLAEGSEERQYDQQVDYIYHAKDTVLSPEDATARVDELRADGVEWQDGVEEPADADAGLTESVPQLQQRVGSLVK